MPGSTGAAGARRGRRRIAQPVGALVSRALKDLGVPSARVTAAVETAWTQASNPAWRSVARPSRLLGGVLEIEVSSAPLREELAQFHSARLLAVLRQALPDTTLLGLRFMPGGGDAPR
jgi:hypothetical protein